MIALCYLLLLVFDSSSGAFPFAVAGCCCRGRPEEFLKLGGRGETVVPKKFRLNGFGTDRAAF